MARSQPTRPHKSRMHSRSRLLRLLQQYPLPLRTLVKAISADPKLVSLVLRAAASECARPTADVESAVVLLGTEGLRNALTKSRRKKAVSNGRPALSHADRLRAIRRAITNDRYRIDPHAIAAAMLRELERS